MGKLQGWGLGAAGKEGIVRMLELLEHEMVTAMGLLGVHSLAYGLIGGLGTVFGPLLGVALDIGVLEATRSLQGYRMIVFGGLVAVLLIYRPRGLLDERLVDAWRRR